MAGRKQHYIPQCHLRAFAAPGAGKYEQVWVYPRDRACFRTATHGVGAERFFYAPDPLNPDPALDATITDYEGSLAPKLEALRAQPAGAVPDILPIAEALVHLSVRGQHIRGSFSTMASEMADAMRREFGPALIQILSKPGEPHPWIRKQLYEEYQKYAPLLSLQGMTFAKFEQFALPMVRAQSAQVSGFVQNLANMITERASQLARDGQLRALQSHVSPPERVQRLAKLSWQILEVSTPMLLPDCIALAFMVDSTYWPLSITDHDTIVGVYFPLNSGRIALGGCIPESGLQPNVIRESMARFCLEYFVATEQSHTLETLQPLIGSGTSPLVQRLVKEAIADGALSI